MNILKIPAYLGKKFVAHFKEYLTDHQNPKNRLGHHIGLITGTVVGVGAMTAADVDPKIAIPVGTAIVYACAIPSHRLEGNKSATIRTLQEITSIKDAPLKLGKVASYMAFEPMMSILALSGTLRPIMRGMGLNPLGADKTAPQEVANAETPQKVLEVEVKKVEEILYKPRTKN